MSFTARSRAPLDALLREQLADADAWIAAGAVYVDGKRARAGAIVEPGASVSWHPDGLRAAAAGEAILRACPPKIVHRDDDLLIVDKPAGVPVQATRQARAGTLEAWLDGQVDYAAFHHRLDREACGLVCVAIHPRANAALASAFAGRIARRTYRVDVAGVPFAPSGAWRHRLVESGGARTARPWSARGQPMESTWRCERRGAWSRLHVSLQTGRTHQIRLQAAAAGTPVVGDLRYGGPPADALRLQAAWLELPRRGRVARWALPEPAWGPAPYLVHVTDADGWRAAVEAGALRPASLGAQGFVHLSRVEQVQATLARHFIGRDGLVALHVDPAGLDVRWEAGEPGELFPHLYGPLPVAAVRRVEPLGG